MVRISWNLELLREFNQNWRIGLSNSSSFRSPVSSELYGFGGNTNLNLKLINRQRLILKELKNSDLNLSLFRNNLTNLIDFDYQNYVLKNISEASNKGIEIRYRMNTESWDLAILLRSQDPKDNNGNQLLRRSKRSGSLTLSRDLYGF